MGTKILRHKYAYPKGSIPPLNDRNNEALWVLSDWPGAPAWGWLNPIEWSLLSGSLGKVLVAGEKKRTTLGLAVELTNEEVRWPFDEASNGRGVGDNETDVQG